MGLNAPGAAARPSSCCLPCDEPRPFPASAPPRRGAAGGGAARRLRRRRRRECGRWRGPQPADRRRRQPDPQSAAYAAHDSRAARAARRAGPRAGRGAPPRPRRLPGPAGPGRDQRRPGLCAAGAQRGARRPRAGRGHRHRHDGHQRRLQPSRFPRPDAILDPGRDHHRRPARPRHVHRQHPRGAARLAHHDPGRQTRRRPRRRLRRPAAIFRAGPERQHSRLRLPPERPRATFPLRRGLRRVLHAGAERRQRAGRGLRHAQPEFRHPGHHRKLRRGESARQNAADAGGARPGGPPEEDPAGLGRRQREQRALPAGRALRRRAHRRALARNPAWADGADSGTAPAQRGGGGAERGRRHRRLLQPLRHRPAMVPGRARLREKHRVLRKHRRHTQRVQPSGHLLRRADGDRRLGPDEAVLPRPAVERAAAGAHAGDRGQDGPLRGRGRLRPGPTGPGRGVVPRAARPRSPPAPGSAARAPTSASPGWSPARRWATAWRARCAGARRRRSTRWGRRSGTTWARSRRARRSLRRAPCCGTSWRKIGRGRRTGAG